MKTSFIRIRTLMAALACLSCAKVQMTEPDSFKEKTATVPVTFRLAGATETVTKMTGVTASYENLLERWACYVYAGTLEQIMANGNVYPILYFKSSDNIPRERNLPVGIYTAFVMANEEEELFSESYDRYTFDYMIDDFVTHEWFSPGSIYMTGYIQFTVTADSVNEVTIRVQRVTGKVLVQNISADFEKAAFRSKEVILKNIFLTNISSASPLFSFVEIDKGSFYNKQGLRADGQADHYADHYVCDLDINHTLQSAGGTTRTAMTTPHVFYPFENLISADDDSRNETWCPRCTRLVVELLIDGVTHYYSVTIPMLRRNYCYNISQMTITGPGSADPERDVPQSVEVTFSPADEGWDSSFTIYEES